jgi:TonB family protein
VRITAVVGLIAFLGGYSAGFAGTPVQPAGPWHVDYEDAQCVASRSFGADQKPIILELVPSATGAAMRILFVRNGETDQTQQEASLRIAGEDAIHTFAFVYPVPQSHHRVISINVPMAKFRAAASAPSIGVETESLRVDLSTSLLPQVLTALDSCLADLQQEWHVTNPLPKAAAQAPGTIAGTGELQPVFTPRDYPAVALYHGQSGSVGVSILVDETGKVADCSVDQPSGIGILDVATCVAIEKRAHFRPAMDENGKPRRSAVSQTVVWRITG